MRRASLPPGTWIGRALVAGVAAGLLGASPSHAGPVEHFGRQLSGGSDVKLRLQAVVGLARVGGRGALAALVPGLKDESEAVRGAAVASLRKLASSAPVETREASEVFVRLCELARGDASATVRKEATLAGEALIQASPGDLPRTPCGGGTAPPGARHFVLVGPASAGRTDADPPVLLAMRDALVDGIDRTPALTTHGNGRGLPSYFVDGSLRRLDVQDEGSGKAVSCSANFLVARMPGRSIVAVFTGGAHVVTGGRSAEAIRAAQLGCVRGLAEDVHRSLRGYLKVDS